MTRKEFVEKLFGEQIFTDYSDSIADKGCQGFNCPPDSWCETCKYGNFWNEVIDMSTIGKTILNMLYGTEQPFVIGGRGAGKTHVIERLLELSEWQRFPRILDTLDFESIRDIVDDALDNGFEFKVFNSTLYYREKDYANTDSVQDID